MFTWPTPLEYPEAMSKYTKAIAEVYFDMDVGYLSGVSGILGVDSGYLSGVGQVNIPSCSTYTKVHVDTQKSKGQKDKLSQGHLVVKWPISEEKTKSSLGTDIAVGIIRCFLRGNFFLHYPFNIYV